MACERVFPEEFKGGLGKLTVVDVLFELLKGPPGPLSPHDDDVAKMLFFSFPTQKVCFRILFLNSICASALKESLVFFFFNWHASWNLG